MSASSTRALWTTPIWKWWSWTTGRRTSRPKSLAVIRKPRCCQYLTRGSPQRGTKACWQRQARSSPTSTAMPIRRRSGRTTWRWVLRRTTSSESGERTSVRLATRCVRSRSHRRRAGRFTSFCRTTWRSTYPGATWRFGARRWRSWAVSTRSTWSPVTTSTSAGGCWIET